MQPLPMTRRDALRAICAGFGYLALTGLTTEAAAPYQNPLSPKSPHFTPRARRVIFLAMQGGPSHLDTFDYKPKLVTSGGKGKLITPVSPFRQHGQCGLWISDLFPKLAVHADELCIVRSMHTDIPNHPQAFAQLHTGSTRFVRPSVGAWTLYGLGTQNQNLPGFISINPGRGDARNYGSAFLPATFQGTPISLAGGGGANKPVQKVRATAGESGLGNIHNSQLTPELQRAQLDLVQSMNRELLAQDSSNTELEGVIQSYELAFRMQTEAPKVMDFSKESAATLAMYGIGGGVTDSFGRQCLMARRFAEAGVRYIEISHGGWDQHNNLRQAIGRNCAATDQPIAALLTDLRQRGLLKDTLVIWGGEFGRTPDSQKADGRGHNAKGYTMWMAGGGTRGGLSFGATDDFGGKAVEDKVHIHDLHATILHLLGLDHEKLTYRYAGRDYRLTDVSGNVVKGLLS